MDIIKENGQGRTRTSMSAQTTIIMKRTMTWGGDGAYFEKRVSNRLNEIKEVEEDALKPRKAVKTYKLRKKRKMNVQRQIKKIYSSTSLKASKN